MGDDPNFATTVSTNIGTKVSKSGDVITTTGTNNQAPLQLRSASGLRHQFATDAQDDAYYYMYDSAGANTVAFRTDGNPSFIAGGGNVGIGTSNPQALLDVSDSTSNEPQIRLTTATATNYLSIARDSSTGHYEFKSEENGSAISFHTDPDGSGSQSRLLIDRYGRTLIGDYDLANGYTPYGQLTVRKNVNNGTAVATNISDLNDATLIIHNQDTAGTGNKSALVFAHAGSPGIPSAIVSTKQNGNWRTHLSFYTNNITGGASTGVMQEQMRIDHDGKVGIGTSNPQTQLEVDGVISSRTNGSSGAFNIGVLEINSNGTPSQVKITTNIPYSGTINAHTVRISGFRYGSAETADILISWHVYLNQFWSRTASSSGGWAPDITLGVENNKVVIHLSSPGYWPKLVVESLYNAYGGADHADGWSWTEAPISSDANTPNQTVSYKQNFGNNFVMKADGNVGIGEDTPLAKLHVVGGRTSGTTYNTIIAAGGVNSTDGSGARIILTGCENDPLARGTVIEGISAGTGNSHKLNFKTNSGSEVPATRMTIGPTGNVGIGTDNPQAKLHVEGNIRSSANIGVTQTDGDYLAKLYQSSADGFLELYTGEATPVSRVKLSAYGNSYIAPSTTSGLGLGTTSPSERLHVVGDIQQQSTHNGSDKCIEAFFNIYTNTSYNTVWTANINTNHQGMFYEVICYGGDWGSHSSARVIKRGFVNGYDGYTGHQEIESAGPYASSISGQLLWSGNTVTYQMRLDTGGVTLRGMVRLIGHFTGYTVY